MNDALQNYARTQLKEMLAQCTEAQQIMFKRMYSLVEITPQGAITDLMSDINTVVDNMPEEKLDWAMQQCQRTIAKAGE